MKRYFVYFFRVLKHKYYVFFACIKLRVPIYIGIAHDISKFFPYEFIKYAKHFYNSDGSKRELLHDPLDQELDFKLAFLHHKNNNKHHFSHWIIFGDNGKLEPLEIPEIYVREMIADWVGAGIAYVSKFTPSEWYAKEKNNLILHDNTKMLIEKILTEL